MILLVAAMLSSLASVNTGVKNYSDEEIKHRIVMSCCYIDNSKAASRAFNYAKSLCADDKARFARLLGEIAQTNDVYIARQIISDLGFYGTKNELPVLYAEIASKDVSSEAMCAILRIEGLSDRTIKAGDEYLNHSEHTARLRYEVCNQLLEEMKKIDRESLLWGRSRAVAVDFMTNHNLFYEWVDMKMIEIDPSFELSDDRVAIMKSIIEHEKREHRLKYPKAVLEKIAADRAR